MFNNNLIEKRVMAVIREKISLAQKEYNDGVEDLKTASSEQKETIRQELRAVDERLSSDKIKLADNLVNGILQKIL